MKKSLATLQASIFAEVAGGTRILEQSEGGYLVTLVENFVTKVIAESSFEELDRIYLTNRVLALVGDGVLEVETDKMI